MTNGDKEEYQRRPNPKGWVPPKAPYNPYDPTDLRPPEGYPSEFKIPGNKPSGFSSLPKDPTQYRKVNEVMKRLNYTPRPLSELYPGQYKVLRKVNTNTRFDTGSRLFATWTGGAIVVFFLFFYRWNEGKENVTSDFYRWQLKFKEGFFGLSEQEKQDLYHPKGSSVVVKSVKDSSYIPEELRRTSEGNFALNRPSERHVLEAERIKQQREEDMLRAEDKSTYGSEHEPVKAQRKKWFGIF